MKWTTTTLFWLATFARGFQRTERSDKMRPIFTETRGLENDERPRRRIPQFRGANHDRNRVRKPCVNPLRESGNRAAGARIFRASALFALSITSVCGGANFSQALMFSSPLLLLKRKRRRIVMSECCGNVENPPKKNQNPLARKKKALQGPIHTAAEWARIARESKAEDLWCSYRMTRLSTNQIAILNEKGIRCLRCGGYVEFTASTCRRGLSPRAVRRVVVHRKTSEWMCSHHALNFALEHGLEWPCRNVAPDELPAEDVIEWNENRI